MKEHYTRLPYVERQALIGLFTYRAQFQYAYFIDGQGPEANGERIVEALEEGRVLTSIPLDEYTRQH